MDRSRFSKKMVTIGAIALLAGCLHAAQPQEVEAADPEARGARDRLVLRGATELIGEEVRNTEGKKLGAIHDVVLTENHHRVAYVVLARGGLLGLGRNLYAIPWSALRVGFDNAYLLGITREQLKQADEIEGRDWPTSAVRGWIPTESGRGDRVVYQGPTAEESRAVQDRRVSRILGRMVVQDRKNVGEIEDLVVEWDGGDIAYVTVSYGGLLGLGEEHAAIPPTAIAIPAQRRAAELQIEPGTIERYAFAPGSYPNLARRPIAQRPDGERPSAPADWPALGYVPPEPQRPEGRIPEGQTLPTVSEIEPRPLDYPAIFAPEALATAFGTVTALGTYDPGPMGLEGLRVDLRTEDGESVTVYAGPRAYSRARDFSVQTGHRLAITGARIQVGGRSIFLVSQIAQDGESLLLREPTGEPLWDAQTGRPQEQPNLFQPRATGG